MDLTKLEDGLYALMTTSKGEILLSLEYKKCPMTVCNFVGLAEGNLNLDNMGTPFYDGLTFHRVIKDFMIQGGCPKGNGTGGPGYSIKEEFTTNPHNEHKDGALAMARSQNPDSAGSQFYFCLGPQPMLDSGYTVFGQTIEGKDVIAQLRVGDVIETIEIENAAE